MLFVVSALGGVHGQWHGGVAVGVVGVLCRCGVVVRWGIESDVVIGSVLVPGARTPHLVDHETVLGMVPGSVLVDIAVDQGGCFEDSHPTTHADPTFVVGGSVFYCVANMPGAVPCTSTYALTNATMRYVLLLADEGSSGIVTGKQIGRAHV